MGPSLLSVNIHVCPVIQEYEIDQRLKIKVSVYVQYRTHAITVQSTLDLKKADTLGIWKKCPLVELSAYKNYSHKRTLEKNRVDGRLQGS